MRLRSFGMAALVAATPILAQIPNDGRILVLKQDQGIEVVRFLGPNSVKGFFVGSKFTWVESDAHNPDPTFWMDGVLVQWMHFTRKEIECARPLTGDDPVEFYFRYETDYLKRVSDVDASQLHIERFAFTGKQASDGLRHRFLIWTATPHGGDAKQYWIVTDHPKGLEVMSLIPRQPANGDRIKTLIDSYMANYTLLRPDEATFRLNQYQELKHQKTPPQVPSIKRLHGENSGESTLQIPAEGSQSGR